MRVKSPALFRPRLNEYVDQITAIASINFERGSGRRHLGTELEEARFLIDAWRLHQTWFV